LPGGLRRFWPTRYAERMSFFSFFARPAHSLGMILLAIWLILYGAVTAPFLKFHFAHSGDLLAGLAIAAGVLLLMKR